MKRNVKILLFSFFTLAFAMIFMVSDSVFADSETNISLVKTENGKYIVYAENLNESFKFSLSSDDNAQPTEYDVSSVDSNNNNVAVIDPENFDSNINTLYLWIKKNSGEITKNTVDLTDYISFENVKVINHLTHIIPVKNDEVQETITDSESKKRTVVTGKIVIDDDNTKNYEYAMIKLPSVEEASKLNELVEKINNFNENTNMYEVTTTYKAIIKVYEKLLSNTQFTPVENMEILQPEDSVNGDKYVILLRKIDGDEVVSEDIQILTCKRIEDEGVDKVVTQKEVDKAVKLPVTGDNIFLIGGFVALIVTLIVLVVLKKKSAKNAQ